jgi:hypothetical protein
MSDPKVVGAQILKTIDGLDDCLDTAGSSLTFKHIKNWTVQDLVTGIMSTNHIRFEFFGVQKADDDVQPRGI